jgi:hypothetical protein
MTDIKKITQANNSIDAMLSKVKELGEKVPLFEDVLQERKRPFWAQYGLILLAIGGAVVECIVCLDYWTIGCRMSR